MLKSGKSLPRRRALKLVIQYQVILYKLAGLYLFGDTHAPIREIEAMRLRERKLNGWEGLEGGKGSGGNDVIIFSFPNRKWEILKMGFTQQVVSIPSCLSVVL